MGNRKSLESSLRQLEREKALLQHKSLESHRKAESEADRKRCLENEGEEEEEEEEPIPAQALDSSHVGALTLPGEELKEAGCQKCGTKMCNWSRFLLSSSCFTLTFGAVMSANSSETTASDVTAEWEEVSAQPGGPVSPTHVGVFAQTLTKSASLREFSHMSPSVWLNLW